jgi:hypothetical protein
LVILGLAIFLLASIAGLSRERSKTNATWLLAVQALTTTAAVGALLLQQIPVPPKVIGFVAFAIPLAASWRHYRPETWTPKPITDRTLITDLVVEVGIVSGAIALMIWLHSFGLILWVVAGSLSIVTTVSALRMNRLSERRFVLAVPTPEPPQSPQDQSLAS